MIEFELLDNKENLDVEFTGNSKEMEFELLGGTNDYRRLKNKPQINDVELIGNKTLHELGIQPEGNYIVDEDYTHTDNNYTDNEKTKLASLENYDDTEIRELIDSKQPRGNYALKNEIPTKNSQLQNDSGFISEETDPTVPNYVKSITQQNITNWNNKQEQLISGTNIKTINNQNILGNGNINIESGASDYLDLTNKPKINNVELSGNKSLNDLGIQPAGDYALESEIPDVSNFITNTVDDLVNYYKKAETFTKEEVNDLISAITTMDIQVVQTLPTEDISTTTIYLVPKTTVEQNDVYDEYIYVSNAWEHIGSTDVDLSGYQTKIDSSHKLASDLVDDSNSNNKFVTSSEKTTWNGKYSKPTGGIPKSDLASSVQTSLEKADTAIQDTELQSLCIDTNSPTPNFDNMTPIATYEYDISDKSYHPVYTLPNTGLSYSDTNIVVAYRITATGTNIYSSSDIIDVWHNPCSYPLTTVMHRTLSTSASTTGIQYLRAVYPKSTYLNDSNYPLGQEIVAYNTTIRHIKIEVFKTPLNIIWKTSADSSIYIDSTYNANNSITLYNVRGWIYRQPQSFVASSAGYANYVNSYECATIGSAAIKAGNAGLPSGHFAYLADDGLVYDISNTTKNISPVFKKVGVLNNAVNKNTAITSTYFRTVMQLSTAAIGNIPHATLSLGNRVFLRCTMDANGYIHSDNYLDVTMSPGYTWLPFGVATASNAINMDTRNQNFYTLDSNGKLTHLDGLQIAGL